MATITKIATIFYMSTTFWGLRRLAISESSPARLGGQAKLNIFPRNRYLILDVLGQGTFGQVVKCQNLKTQEVVAVKVIKNRTAYFNQSMMEVSVLDLVSRPRSARLNIILMATSSILSLTKTTTIIF